MANRADRKIVSGMLSSVPEAVLITQMMDNFESEEEPKQETPDAQQPQEKTEEFH